MGVKERSWSGNASVADAARALRAATRAVVTTHAKPDGDAIGSALAATRALRAIGVEATAVFFGPWFSRFDPFLRDTPNLRLPEGDASALSALPEPDAVLIVDTGSWAQLRDGKAWLAARAAKAIVLDHHPTGDADVAALRVVQTDAAAAGEIVGALCVELLRRDGARALPVDIAEPLYLGVATDTGWFRYANTTARTMRFAADLLDAGVDHSRVLRISEQSDRPSRLRLIGRALESLELLDNERIALMTISMEDFARTGADLEDAGGLTDLAQSLQSVRVVAVLTEVERAVTKVSLRSKPAAQGEPDADVSAVARALGGGGHVRAAGVRIEAPLAEARARVAAALVESIR